MKTNKKYLAASIATITIIALGIGSTSAMNGQGTGEQGKRGMSELVTAEQRVEVENMTQEDRQKFIQKMRAEHGISNERMGDRSTENMGDRNGDKMKDGKKGDRSKVSQFITEAQKNELRDSTQEERKAFIQKLRAENGLSNERMGDRNGDTEKTGEGRNGKKGSKGAGEGRNK